MMRRMILRLAGIGLFAALAVGLAERPGTAVLEWRGWRIDTSAALLFAVVAVVAAVTALLYRSWVAAARIPRGLRRLRRGRRRERGYRALTQGLAAAAGGDGAEAARLARRADALLDEPPLTLLLNAQAAELAGDEAAARRCFDEMLQQPETAFPALRGLLAQARERGDDGGALDYARRAFALRPRTPWVVTTLFDLQVKADLWQEALTTVEAGLKHGVYSAADGRRSRVVVLLACSAAAGDAGDPRRALELARRAHGIDPDYMPATLRLVGLLAGGGQKRAAARLCRDAWAARPHPEIARLYLAIRQEEDGLTRMRRIERLVAENSDDIESHFAVAGAAIEAGLWGAARARLDAADAVGGRDARLCRLRADLEEAQHNDAEAARRWLLAAAEAAPGPGWLCGSCGAAWRHWSPVCGGCEGFATLDWARPRGGPAAAALPVAAGTG